MSDATVRGSFISGLAIVAVAIMSGLAVWGWTSVSGGTASGLGVSGHPHIDHVTLPLHKHWQVISVVPYEGLEEVELIKFNWPTQEDPHLAFSLSREGLKVGDEICLDHVREIDTFWAHPVPQGGCEAHAKRLGK